MVRLNNPKLQQFLEDEVNTGRYASIDAAVEAAVALLKEESDSEDDLDDEILGRLEQADAQIARGDYYTIEQVKAMFEEKIARET